MMPCGVAAIEGGQRTIPVPEPGVSPGHEPRPGISPIGRRPDRSRLSDFFFCKFGLGLIVPATIATLTRSMDVLVFVKVRPTGMAALRPR
jgi:hypothetical protein